jgi:hypothetical protein
LGAARPVGGVRDAATQTRRAGKFFTAGFTFLNLSHADSKAVVITLLATQAARTMRESGADDIAAHAFGGSEFATFIAALADTKCPIGAGGAHRSATLAERQRFGTNATAATQARFAFRIIKATPAALSQFGSTASASRGFGVGAAIAAITGRTFARIETAGTQNA